MAEFKQIIAILAILLTTAFIGLLIIGAAVALAMDEAGMPSMRGCHRLGPREKQVETKTAENLFDRAPFGQIREG